MWARVLTHSCTWFLPVSYRETLIERTTRNTFFADTCAYTNTPPYPALRPTREQPYDQDRSPPIEHLLGTAECKGVLIAAPLGLPTFAPKAEDTGACAS